VFCLAVTSAIATMTVPAAAQSDTAFHEVETKYIFGLFTLGSATGIEGEKAIELNTTAGFGKRAGRYAATETEIEVEYTPNQYVQIELDRRCPTTIFATCPDSITAMAATSTASKVISDFSSSIAARPHSP